MPSERKYKFSDAILLTHIGKVLTSLPGDLSNFEAQFPMINQFFQEELQVAYQTALEEGGDDVAQGRVGPKTQRMADVMQESQGLVKQLRFWVSYAFDTDRAAQRSFNLHKFWSVANNQPELIRFMYLLSSVVQERTAELVAAGASRTLLERIEANATSLASADAEQEQSKSGRSSATQKRINALNEIHRSGHLLSESASILFEEDPVKVAFYAMPSTRTTDGPEEDTTLDEEFAG